DRYFFGTGDSRFMGGTYLSASSDQSRVKTATPAFFWFPSSSLGTVKSKLQLREIGSWSFHICIPKLELGNEYRPSNGYN
ncbi:MAG: hypothetical protein QX196_12685, partial [Methylococcaceae bacterium]